jgi:hypothetical protein
MCSQKVFLLLAQKIDISNRVMILTYVEISYTIQPPDRYIPYSYSKHASMVIKTSIRMKAACRCTLDIDSFRCTITSYHNRHELIQLLSDVAFSRGKVMLVVELLLISGARRKARNKRREE